MLTLDDFDFVLPDALIAQHPKAERRASRLLQVTNTEFKDLSFANLPTLINSGDLLVFNNTRVIKARLFGRKESGGKVEIMIERIVSSNEAIAQIRASKSPKPDTHLILEDETTTLKVTGRCGAEDSFFALKLIETPLTNNFYELLEKTGHLPLPPYISREAAEEDESRYQTVFAENPGAVAAPTAGLHFDEALLGELKQKGVNLAYLTLHVGAGTFQPVRVHNIAEHSMHTEHFEIPVETVLAINATHAKGKRVFAVGTTSLRALESAAQTGTLKSGAAETKIFITPGFQFKVVDCLITNFHLPKSTLLMLVSAFAGMDTIRHAYQHAIEQNYRFFSYGDAMLLEKNTDAI